jgi:hypothetical protein
MTALDLFDNAFVPFFLFIAIVAALIVWMTIGLIRDMRHVDQLSRQLDEQQPITTTDKE